MKSRGLLVRYNYLFLLSGLLLLLIASTISDQLTDVSTQILMDFALASTLVLGVWSMVKSRIAFLAAWAMASLAIALGVSANLFGKPELGLVASATMFVFLFVSASIVFHDVMRGGAIDVNRLLGAVCIYLMLGINWGILYLFLDLHFPDAILGVEPKGTTEYMAGYLYFSFVTLTTLGYGDVQPVMPLARGLAYLEAIFGQIYLTVMVAALVGIHISTHQSPMQHTKSESSQ